jgi:hypothetical protein
MVCCGSKAALRGTSTSGAKRPFDVSQTVKKSGLFALFTHVALDKPERQIDAGHHPGGGPYRTIGNKDAVHLDPDFRKALLQLLSQAQWVVAHRPSSRPASWGADY